MTITTSKAVELVKAIKNQDNKNNFSKLCVAYQHNEKPFLHLIDLDQEDLKYLKSKYKIKALKSLEGVQDYIQNEINDL